MELKVTCHQRRRNTPPLRPSAQSCSCVDSAEKETRTEKRNAITTFAHITKTSSAFTADKEEACAFTWHNRIPVHDGISHFKPTLLIFIPHSLLYTQSAEYLIELQLPPRPSIINHVQTPTAAGLRVTKSFSNAFVLPIALVVPINSTQPRMPDACFYIFKLHQVQNLWSLIWLQQECFVPQAEPIH